MKHKSYLENWMDISAEAYKEGPTAFYKLPLMGQYRELHKNSSMELKYLMTLEGAGVDDHFGPAHTCGLLANLMNGTAKIYKIADKFGTHLNRTKLDLPTKILPYHDGKYYLIEFPMGFHDEKSGDWHYNAIVYMGVRSEFAVDGMYHPFSLSLNDCERGLVMVFPDYDSEGKGTGRQTFVRMDPTKAATIEEVMTKHIRVQLNSQEHLKKLVEYTLKCILYIDSGDPDLSDVTRKPLLTSNPKKIRRHIKNECLFDYVSVGYGLHKRHYDVSEGEVAGHYRWQPYGPGKTQVKLIWIDEHVRNYGKG